MSILRNISQNKTQIVVGLIFVFEFVFPHYSLALDPASAEQSVILPTLVVRAAEADEEGRKVQLIQPSRQCTTDACLATGPIQQVVATYQIPITAYSSTIDQCDSTPCITANGFDLCANNQENVIAANFLPFGTKVRIPEVFGDRIFTVQDRMNARYYYRADVWMKARADAKKFGIVYAKLEVIK
ncbi:MAG: hypothetical protein WC675_05380 [Patescibacteria group bacterium]|jgi:3D (Asp-Asp-Asp) domain-containing protein